MSNRMRSVTIHPCLAIAATLCAVMATGVCAAADTPTTAEASAPATTQQPLEQLDEIWVRGVRLARAITDAQDDVVRLYNKLNKDYRYGITCGYASISQGSMIMQRVCMPNFVVDSLQSYPVTANGNGPAPVEFVTPSPEALLLAHRKDYEANVAKVLNSDAQLLQKYNHLLTLRQEMAATQQRYVLTRKVRNAAIKPAKGPRAS